MNEFLKNLEKIEFVITNSCTGNCKHCSQGEHLPKGEHINPEMSADAVRKIASVYKIQTVMAFGGEPLLYPQTVFEIMKTAKQMKIPKRQVITNGFFSKDKDKIRETALLLKQCHVNDLLLSADAFHEETIPLEVVKFFAEETKNAGVSIRMQPAWLVNRDHDNPYNIRTKEILSVFSEMGICENDGNVIFPEGNARKYLKEYFLDELPENPYIENPFDVKCLSFSPNGNVLDGNINRQDIMEIIKNYKPDKSLTV